MIFTDTPEVNPNLTLDDLPGTFGDAVNASMSSALYNSPMMQITRTAQDSNAGGPLLDYETARTKSREAGVDIKIDPKGMSEGALNLLIERKRFQAKTQDALARGPHGFVAGSAYFLSGLGAAMLDPINLASAYIPVARGIGMAEDVARAGALGEAGAAATATGRAAARLRVGAVEGGVGQALLEPLTAYRASQEQEDYGITDTLLNVGFGTVLGAVAHTGLGALGDRAVAAERGRKATELIDAAKGVREKPVNYDIPAVFRKDSAAAKLQAADMETNAAVFRSEIAAAADGRKMDNSVLVPLEPVKENGSPMLFRGVTKPWDEAARQDIEFWAPSHDHAAKYGVGGEVVSAPANTSNFVTIKESEYTSEKLNALYAGSKDVEGVRVVDDKGNDVLYASFNKPQVNRFEATPIDPIKVQQAAAASHLPENDVHYDAQAKAEVDRAVAERAAEADPAEAVLRATQEAQTDLATLSKQLGLDPEKNAAMRGADDLASTASRYSKAIEAYASCQVRT